MKVTFVYPGIAMIGFNSLGGDCHDTISINLGLGYISSYLKKNSNHTVNLIDLRELEGWDHFESELGSRSPDVVGIYCNTVNFDNSVEAAGRAKKCGIRVVMGGPHATYDPQSLLATGQVDNVIVGEGEIAFCQLMDALSAGRTPDEVIHGEKIIDLDAIPFPDRDLYNMDRILAGPGIFPYPNRYVGILASRGCHYNCAFCQPLERKIFGPKVRTRSVANVMQEVREVIEKYDANFIMFECDTLTTNKSWALELSREMSRVHIAWGAQSRVDTIDDELAAAMRGAGCMVLFFGFESGSQRLLNLLRKGITPEKSVEAGRICRRHKILIFANYMLGIPTETREDLEMTLQMMKAIRPELPSAAYFAPIPGSDLYDYCQNNDLIKSAAYRDYVRNPAHGKIKGIDYTMLDRYRSKIAGCRKPFWMELHFACHVLDRWSFLLRKGFTMNILMELAAFLPESIKIIVKRIRRSESVNFSQTKRHEKKFYPGI
jgi:radical SAM superfamily enzyme YgiQ (UPF0313 family)